MSSYLVEPKTINTIISYIADKDDNSWEKTELNNIKYPTNQEDLSELGQSMLNLNIAGVNKRYADYEQPPLIDYHYQYKLATKIQVLKSFQCWLYQCDNGNISGHQLFKTMDRILNQLAKDIIYTMPEYDKAVWG